MTTSAHKIRNHLRTRGEEWVEVTPPLVLYWWRLLNEAVFNGILPIPTKVHCRNFHDGSFGWCKVHKRSPRVEYGIRRELDTRFTFMEILAHEMVHHYEWITYKKVSHGKNFFSWEHILMTTVGLPLNTIIE